MGKGVIGFIGLGNMTQAILAGMRASAVFADAPILGFDRNLDKREAMRERFHIAIAADALEVARSSETLVLAIKPQGMDSLMAELSPVLNKKQLVISLAAGKRLPRLEDLVGKDLALARAIPNINAKAGASMTAVCHNERLSGKQVETLLQIFDAIGSVRELPEDMVPAFSAIAGAGPAFAYAFIDALATAGVRAGLPRAMAQQAACGMLFGSAKLAAESSEHPRALMDQVTSPGGTTIEGVHKLSELGFEYAVREAVAAVIAKDQSL